MKLIQDRKRAPGACRNSRRLLTRAASLSLAAATLAAPTFSGNGAAAAGATQGLGSNGEYSLTATWDLFPYYSPSNIEVAPKTGEVFVWDNLGIERFSSSGQLLERFDRVPDGSTAVDQDGNLVIAERYGEVPGVRTVSPSGEPISVLTIPDLSYAGPLATLGNSIWVGVNKDQGVAVREYLNGAATGRTISIADATFLISPGFSYGDNMVATPQGNLAIVVKPAAEGSNPLVRTYSPEGRLLSQWSWLPSAPDASPHSGGPGALAVDPEGQVLLLGDDGAGGSAFLEVFAPSGSLQQRIDLATLHGTGRPAGITVDRNGRVYVTFTSYQEGGHGKVFLLDRLRAPSIPVLAWNATACSPFENRIEAAGSPTPSWFEIVTGSLPTGLSLDQATGVISGTPTLPGQTKGTMRASNGVEPSAETPFTFTVEGAKFDSTSKPVLKGEALEGKTMVIDHGSWSPAPEFTYQWYRDGEPIDGAVGQTYVLSGLDVGQDISAKVRATGACGREATVSTSGVVPATIVNPTPTAGPESTPTPKPEPSIGTVPTSQPEVRGDPPADPLTTGNSALAATGLVGAPMLWLAIGLAAALGGAILVFAARRRRS